MLGLGPGILNIKAEGEDCSERPITWDSEMRTEEGEGEMWRELLNNLRFIVVDRTEKGEGELC